MQLIGMILLLVILILVGVTVGGGVLVLVAYGLGWLLNHIMHLDPFQATALSLAGMLAFGSLATRIFQTIINTMPGPSSEDDEDDEEDEDEEDEDETDFEVEDVDGVPVIYPSIPRERQSLKTPDFSNTRPDDRCPCGSGRKYKNCHGAKRPAA
ncbi:MAG: SEC-C metal-binding domain-containing protein [Chloroflexi bacterium]|nr:SEC-C metal-binding domain-containing protein [Chloroflexota bacterium]